MQIVIAATGSVLSGSVLLSATLRTDCTPVPATLELTAQSNDETDKQLIVGAELLVGDLALTIIKVQRLDTQTLKEGRRVGGLAVVALLSGCQRLIEPVKRAVILSDTSVLEAMRACGAKMAGLDDVRLPRFVCLVGQLPTVELAKRLQQEAAIICLKKGKLAALKIDRVMQSEPVARFDSSAITLLDSPRAQALQVPSYVSIGADGSTVEGGVIDGKPMLYRANLDARQAHNLQKVLIHRATMTRSLDNRLRCGAVVQVGECRLVVLTAAHRVDTGALGGSAVFATKVWLSSVE